VSLPLFVYLLTPLPGIAVVLTRLRLGGTDSRSGRLQLPKVVLNVHTWVGVAAGIAWIGFLLTGIGKGDGNNLLGVLALALLWITAAAGLILLSRWRSPKGKRSRTEIVADSWSAGPGLSALAHIVVVIVVLIFTWAYSVGAV
jgi:amino acid permease